jgi:hypothetical protein
LGREFGNTANSLPAGGSEEFRDHGLFHVGNIACRHAGKHDEVAWGKGLEGDPAGRPQF